MFGLFGKKEKPIPVTDMVWIHEAAMKAGLLQLLKEKPDAILIAWFEDTAAAAENYLQSGGLQVTAHLSRQLHGSLTSDKEVVFLGHYPLYKKEQELFGLLSARSITVISSLDEPLFTYFGGERIAGIMKAMGVAEAEAVSHTMISSALQKAQQKLEKKVTVEMPAVSAADWFRKNAPEK